MFTLQQQREWNALIFDLEWLKNHIPIADRIIKVNNRYQIQECPHCIKFYEDLKHHDQEKI